MFQGFETPKAQIDEAIRPGKESSFVLQAVAPALGHHASAGGPGTPPLVARPVWGGEEESAPGNSVYFTPG